MHNPFFHRQGITDPSHFHGRGELVRGLLDMVAFGQSCAVVGERRIGKTSLLTYLTDRRVLADHGLRPEATVIALLDFLALQACSQSELWVEILESLEPSAPDEETRELLRETAAKRGEFPALRRTLRALHRRGIRTVLLCDEFELAVQNPSFDESLFGALRSLAGNEGVVFVTSSRLSLLELEQYQGEAARRKVLGSSFFNIFAEFNVGPFEDWEVAELLASSLEPTPIRFDHSDTVFLDRLAGRHPFFLQLASYHLFAQRLRAAEHTSSPEHLHAEVRDLVQREAAKTFRHLWQNSKKPERTALAALAVSAGGGREAGSLLAGDLTGVSYRTLARLEQRALLRPLDDRSRSPHRRSGPEIIRSYRLFSDLLPEWILANVTATLGGLLSQEEIDRDLTQPPAPQRSEESRTPDRYTLLEEIGRGGAGTVFKAWDGQLERVVALKLLDRELLTSPRHVRRLLSEARICAGIHHPHIVVVYDIDAEGGYLVTEFLAGGSLRDLLEAVPVLVEADVRSLAEQLGEALRAAHDAGLVHRDLKPENILLTQRPATSSRDADRPVLPPIRLADFGTALRLGEPGQARERHAVAGTLRYMSPEQLAGEDVGPQTDIYSLGVVLYEARHGKRPSVGEAGRHGSLVEAGTLDALIARCLDLLPRDRWSSAEQLLEAIRATPVTG